MSVGLAYAIVVVFVVSGLASVGPDFRSGRLSDEQSTDNVSVASLTPTLPSPVGYWDMSTPRAGRILNMVSSAGANDGIVHDALPNENGVYGGCYDFDSVYNVINTNIEVPDAESNLDFNDGTVAAWVKSTYLGASQCIMMRCGDTSPCAGWGLAIWPGAGEILPYASLMLWTGSLTGGQWVLGSFMTNHHLLDGNWHHVAATFAGSTVKFFYDGVWDGAARTTSYPVVSNPSDHLVIGNEDVLWWMPEQISFHGSIDEVSVFNQVLTSAQISELYNWRPYVMFDDVNEQSIVDWTLNVGLGNTGGPATAQAYSPPNSLGFTKISTNGLPARGLSKAISLDYANDYQLSLAFLLPSGVQENGMLLVDDGRAYAWVDALSNGVTASIEFKGRGGSNVKSSVSQGMWHTLGVKYHPTADQYDAYIDGVLVGNLAFRGDPFTRLSIGTNAPSSKRCYGEAYFDDIMYAGSWATLPPTQDSDNDGLPDDEELQLGTDPSGYKKWAVMVVGGFTDLLAQENFENQADEATKALNSRGFTDSSIYFLNFASAERDSDGDNRNDVDALSSRATLQYALSTWLAGVSDADDLTFVYLLDHGGFYLPDIAYFVIGEETVTETDLDQWLFPVSCHNMTIMFDCCNAGYFIDELTDDPSRHDRMVVCAANSESASSTYDDFTMFSYPFFQEIANGQSIEDAYLVAKQFAYDNTARWRQIAAIYDWDLTHEVYL